MHNLKKTFILACVVLAVIPVQAYGWTRTYGYEDVDDVGWCVRATNDGGYILSGSAFPSCWLVKTNQAGDAVWTKTYKGVGRFVEQTSDGGYIVTGIKDDDFWLLKTDSNGDSVWAKIYHPTDSADYPRCIRQTFDGGYIWVGTIDHLPYSIQMGSLQLIKLDSSGDSLWSKIYSYPDKQSLGWSVSQTVDSGFVISGCVNDAAGRHVWLLKTDPHGDTLWTRKYGVTQDGGHCVQPTSDGGYIIVGELYQQETGRDLWLLKTDSLGDTSWTQTYATEGHDIGYWVEQTSDDGYIISGIKNWHHTSGQVCNMWLLKTDFNGDTVWTREFGGEYSDWGHSVCETHDGGYVIGGVKDYDAPEHDIDSDMWLIKTDSIGDTTEAAVSEDPQVKDAYLDIISSIGRQIILKYSNCPGGFQAVIFDASGRKVDELQASGPSGTITWGQGHTPGVYFIRPMSDNLTTTRKVVLIQ